jgi:hypothetical protein
MTDAAPPAPAGVHGSRRRWLALALLCALIVAGAGWGRLQQVERLRAKSAIAAAGGLYNERYQGPEYLQYFERLLSRSPGRPKPECTVLLHGSRFDDRWLSSQRALSMLTITNLNVATSAFSQDALRQLLSTQRLTEFYARNTALADAELLLLNEHTDLMRLDLGGTKITDAGLQQFKPRLLCEITVHNTAVTADGLREWLPQSRIAELGVDGRQLTPELVDVLVGIPHLQEVQLYGGEITEAHLELLARLPDLRRIRLCWTSIGDDVVQDFRARHPQYRMLVIEADGSFKEFEPVGSPRISGRVFAP